MFFLIIADFSYLFTLLNESEFCSVYCEIKKMLNDSIMASELNSACDKDSIMSDMFQFYRDVQNEKIKNEHPHLQGYSSRDYGFYIYVSVYVEIMNLR